MWQFIRQKWLTLLLSILLGWMLWMYANWVETSKDRVEAYFKLRTPPDDVDVVLEPEPRLITLMVQGPTGAIHESTRSDRDVSVVFGPDAVQEIADGKTREIRIIRAMVQNLPPDVEVIHFDPPSFTITVFPRATKTLTVSPPDIIGQPEEGYQVQPAKVVRPREVTVHGPRAVLDQLDHVKPERVDVTGRTDDFLDTERRIQRTYDIEGRALRISCDSTVEVLVPVRRKSEQKTIPGIHIHIAQPESLPPALPFDIVIEAPANPIDLIVSGPPEALNRIDPKAVRAFIDVDVGTLKPNDDTPFKQPLIVVGLPEGVELTDRVIVSARIRLKEPPKTTTETTAP